jgi:hypothetical protein
MITKTTNIFQINILTIALYTIASLISSTFHIEFPMQVIGLTSLFIVTPLTILHAFPQHKLSASEKYLALLTLYFFLYVPIVFFANRVLNISLTPPNLLTLNILIFIIAFFANKFFKRPPETYSLEISPKKIASAVRDNKVLIVMLFAYLSLHAINYGFYRFMPEWDGYSDLIKIEKNTESGSISQSYRGFFAASVTIVSVFTKIDPYFVFTLVLIPLQSTLILVMHRFLALYQIRDRPIADLLLLFTISVPVLNMEIDMIRPQNIFVLFLPILIYFLHRARQEKSLPFAFLSGLILLFGLNYHEFFTFPFIIHTIWLFWSQTKKHLHKDAPREQKIIFIQFCFIAVLLAALLFERMGIFHYILSTAQIILLKISDIHSWKLWFLDHYNSDGEHLEMGWPGLEGAIKYYAYYLSPAMLFIFSLLIFTIVKQKTDLFKNNLLAIILPLLGVFLAFAEIMPRFNYIFLPERFWLFIDILLILSAPALMSFLSQNRKQQLAFRGLVTLLIVVGISGSFYIASAKKSLISEAEYKATVWIKNNTPKDAYFISQSANGPMIRYFAKRSIIHPDPNYFLSDKILEEDLRQQIDNLNSDLEKHLANVTDIAKKFIENSMSFTNFADSVQKEKIAIQKINAEIEMKRKAVGESRYIVYSLDKFNTLYSQREWWNLANAKDANLEKFHKAFPLVYNDGVVYIWKIR